MPGEFLKRYVLKLFTLSLIPNSSRIFANAAARLTPECERATSTISRSIEMGTPLFSKCTVTATYALWFGEVHASVAKLRSPTCSCPRSEFFFSFQISCIAYL
jgi:hypothetical protein